MNIYKNIETKIKAICEELIVAGEIPVANLSRVDAVPPKDAAHGDIATNAAMIIAAEAKTNPRAIAGKLVDRLGALDEVVSAEIAGPGFINLTLKPDVWQAVIPVILEEGAGFGNSSIGAGIRVNVEYVSANPTGPMHVGHGRGAVYGDALAALLIKTGYDVTREYYINDGGGQIEKLADSAYLRYREALGEAIGEIPKGLYPGDYLVAVGEALHRIHGDKLKITDREHWLPIVRDYTVEAMMVLIRDDLAALGIYHDVFTSERALTETGRTEEAQRKLEAMGLIYTGVLEPPKGKTPEDWEPTPQMLFKSTAYGDDCDRAIKKSDGSWAYLAPDMALHYDKVKRGFTRLIDVFGVDHGGYVKRITAAVRALSDDKATLEVKLCQLVKFMRGGEPLKMSKRAGTFITVREVVDEVGRDVFRFIMLTRKNDQPLEFDFNLVKQQTRDNPVFYVQYAHARCKSVLRHAAQDMPEVYDLISSSLHRGGEVRRGAGLASPSKLSPHPNPLPKGEGARLLAKLNGVDELALLKIMANWPRMVEAAALAGEPHRIAFYLHDLASAFHGLWNKGNDDLTLRFLQKDDMDLTAARLAMVKAFADVVASGLHVLGVEPVKEMR